ncbi:hypothetical protein V2G26_006199 [Clonostachys chloroleuca]
MRNLLVLGSSIGALHSALAYYTMVTYSPESPEIDGKIINANSRSFIIGAKSPSTYCDINNPSECPNSSSTLVNNDMTLLASAVPGGQFIWVGLDGSVSYASPHSAFRPPGSQMGGFYPVKLLSDCATSITVLVWQSHDGASGLWACPRSSKEPLVREAVLKASVANFVNDGCLKVEAIQIMEAGDEYGAWAYT